MVCSILYTRAFPFESYTSFALRVRTYGLVCLWRARTCSDIKYLYSSARLGAVRLLHMHVCVCVCLWLWRARVLVALYFVRKGVVEKTRKKRNTFSHLWRLTNERTKQFLPEYGHHSDPVAKHHKSISHRLCCVTKFWISNSWLYGGKVYCLSHSFLLTECLRECTDSKCVLLLR